MNVKRDGKFTVHSLRVCVRVFIISFSDVGNSSASLHIGKSHIQYKGGFHGGLPVWVMGKNIAD